jgi:hypothetical protein
MIDPIWDINWELELGGITSRVFHGPLFIIPNAIGQVGHLFPSSGTGCRKFIGPIPSLPLIINQSGGEIDVILLQITL